jgi:hypothetical protein
MQTIQESSLSSSGASSSADSALSISQVNLSQAMSMIDAGLSQMMKRELVTAAEVTDLLLDVRSLLADVVPSVN